MTCICGCPEDQHEHYRTGRDCGRCGPALCPHYQPDNRLTCASCAVRIDPTKPHVVLARHLERHSRIRPLGRPIIKVIDAHTVLVLCLGCAPMYTVRLAIKETA